MAHFWIARAIGNKKTIILQRVVIIIPWNPYYSSITLQEVTYNIVLNATVDKYYPFVSALVSIP